MKGFDAYSSMSNGVAAKFAADGYNVSMGYLFSYSKFKVLRSYHEALAVSHAEMKNEVIFENGSEQLTASLGEKEAIIIPKLAIATGMPTDLSAVVWRAIDWNAGTGDLPAIRSYFMELHKALKDEGILTGVYGNGLVCRDLLEHGYVHGTMLSCSEGWYGYQNWLPHATIVQKLPQKVHGIDIDPDEFSDSYTGGWSVT